MKTIKRAYKFRFYPQNDLKIILAKTFGCTRFVFNRILDLSEKNYKTKFIANNQLNPNYKPISNTDRINHIVTLKQEFSWLKEVSSIALQQSVKNLNNAYDRFFKKQGNYPQPKKKKNRNSFTITGKNSLHFDKDFAKNKQFYLPKYNKPLNIKFSREFNHLAVSSVTISQEPSGKYFISFLVEEELKPSIAKNPKVSIDLGIKTHAKVYNGVNFESFNLPELIKSIDKKIAKAQRILSRRVKGSNNRNKQRIIVAKLHEKKSNIINDFYHKLSSKLINENQEIIIEDLAVKNMLKNRKLSRSIHSVAWSRFTSMLEYKSDWQNRNLSKANRFYPSSKLCSCCGHINHGLSLKDREWTCSNCNAHHDRDENACLNLYRYKQTVGTTVCGEIVRPMSLKLISTKNSKAVSMKQESSPFTAG